MRVLDINPEDYRAEYQRHGWLHVKDGATREFMDWAQSERRRLIQAEDQSMERLHFKGKKKQYLFEFPDEDSLSTLLDDVAVITGLPREGWMLSERHIKAYAVEAKSRVPAHKDRLQSELVLGFVLEATEDSHVVGYPHDLLTVNPFSSTADWRNSLDEEDLPENALRDVEPTRVFARPGDVHMFRGN